MANMGTNSAKILSGLWSEMKSIHTKGSKCLFVFDLDSTLFDVSPRSQRILQDFSGHQIHRAEFPTETSLIEKSARVLNTDWGVRSALERLPFEPPPSADFYHKVRDFWKSRFFANEYLVHDKPYAGAVEFVKKVAEKRQNHVVYLTGRDVHRMGIGTRESLKQHGFPIGQDNVELALKPNKDLVDTDFKTNWFANIESLEYEKIWFFENEPLNIERVERDHPQIQIVFFDSTHAGLEKRPEHLPTIANFVVSLD